MKIAAKAKINLFLEITGRREDGYHNIVSIFKEIELADELHVSANKNGEVIISECDNGDLPTGADNLIVKAAKLLQRRTGTKEGATFTLRKKIPVGAGLGGGSSDAAAALKLAAKLWQLDLSKEKLAEIGAEIGSDVPFFIYGGTCLCEGRGERVRPVEDAGGLRLLLIKPPWQIATREAYAALEKDDFGNRSPTEMLESLRAGDTKRIAAAGFNRFEAAVFGLEPRQGELHRAAVGCGVLAARLSGSGSCMWCVAGSNCCREKLAAAVRPLGAEVVETC